MILTKICGLSTPETVTTTIENKADYIGLVFYPDSPRHVELETAKYLASFIPDPVEIVGLFVDPDNALLSETLRNVPLTMVQLHGDVSPHRVNEIKEKFNIPVMKALPVETAEDLKVAKFYDEVADWLLFDAKGEELPGGNGIAFDWTILADYKGVRLWFLAGGLTPENVADAIKIAKPPAVDVSSGVESEKGVKDVQKIESFISALKQA